MNLIYLKCLESGLILKEDDIIKLDHRVFKNLDENSSMDDIRLLHRCCHDCKLAEMQIYNNLSR